MADGGEEDMPKDGKIVKELLRSMSIDDYEPRVVHQFLELWYRYIADVLTDAQMYSEHSEKSAIDSDDVKLAIQSIKSILVSHSLHHERIRNKVALPKSVSRPGIPLPPEIDTLIVPNYQLAIPKRRIQPLEETEEDEAAAITNPNQNQGGDSSQDTP